jgi:hypothetical protein
VDIEPRTLTVDEEIRLDAVKKDPRLITDIVEAETWIAHLGHAIAAIEVQLEEARLQASWRLPSQESQAWYRRAGYAKAYLINDREAMCRRERELRGVLGFGEVAEADRVALETIQEQLKLRRTEIQAETGWRKHFVDLARIRLKPDEYETMVDAAKIRARLARGGQPE